MTNEIDLRWVAPKLRADIITVIRGTILDYCEQILREYVQSTVYSRSSGMYERTNEILGAVVVDNIKVGADSATFNVRIDPGMLSHISPADGLWGKHAGFKDQPFTEGLIEILDEGGGSSYHMHPAADFFGKTLNRLDRELVGILADGLAARGWDVSY